MQSNGVSLAQALIRIPSLNPPGEEKACMDFVSNLLEQGGFQVSCHEFAPGRPSIVARLPGVGDQKPLCFTGHLDVVPVGTAKWSHDPFGGQIVDGKLFGRGASDMKSGVAAFISAAMDQIRKGNKFRRGITLAITAGEESGCEGAFYLSQLGVLGKAELLVVAEPSSNKPIIAHKGSIRLSISARGKSSHSAMPELGDNAVDKIAKWIVRLSSHRLSDQPHPLLGHVTVAVTTMHGGQNVNSVPDAAEFTVDVRTTPDRQHADIIEEIALLLGSEAEIKVLTDFKGFATDPNNSAIAPLMRILEKINGARPMPIGAPYFTDASALVPALGNVPTVVIGPGDAAQCHQTDEFCTVRQIEDSFEIYSALIEEMCG